MPMQALNEPPGQSSMDRCSKNHMWPAVQATGKITKSKRTMAAVHTGWRGQVKLLECTPERQTWQTAQTHQTGIVKLRYIFQHTQNDVPEHLTSLENSNAKNSHSHIIKSCLNMIVRRDRNGSEPNLTSSHLEDLSEKI